MRGSRTVARLVPVTVRSVPPLEDEGMSGHGAKRSALAQHKQVEQDTPPSFMEDISRSQPLSTETWDYSKPHLRVDKGPTS